MLSFLKISLQFFSAFFHFSEKSNWSGNFNHVGVAEGSKKPVNLERAFSSTFKGAV